MSCVTLKSQSQISKTCCETIYSLHYQEYLKGKLKISEPPRPKTRVWLILMYSSHRLLVAPQAVMHVCLIRGQDLRLKRFEGRTVDEGREERNVCTLVIKLPNFSAW